MSEEHVQRWHRAGDRLHAALTAKFKAEEEYALALAELDASSRELHLDAARWALECYKRAEAERATVLRGESPQTKLPE